jgi:hypothetical protein
MMRARLAAMLRRMAQRLDPNLTDGRVHHLVTTTDPLAVHIDGKRLHQELLAYKRRNGLGDLGLG